MTEPLSVSPAELLAVGSQLGVNTASLTSVVSAAAGLSTPRPTCLAAPAMQLDAAMSAARQNVFKDAGQGIKELSQGAEVFPPMSAAYTGQDEASGSCIRSANNFQVT